MKNILIVNCIICEKVIINDKEFYSITEVETRDNYKIPLSQVDGINIVFGNEYQFCKAYNDRFNKYFLSIINPAFKIGTEYIFNIQEQVSQESGKYFLLESSSFKQPLKVQAFDWQKNSSKIKCKVVNYEKGLPILINAENDHPNFKIGESFMFKVKGFDKIQDKKGKSHNSVTVALNIENQVVGVMAYEWHKKNLWNFQDIKCEVVGFSKLGIPKLKISDDRHPIYDINSTYKFKVVGFKDKINTKANSTVQVIEIQDDYDCFYEVMALSNQENKLKSGDEIECQVKLIDTKLRLKQVNFGDPFFYAFENIIEDSEVRSKYFTPILSMSDEKCVQMTNQYESRTAFWVFTFCNHVLPKVFHEKILNKNYNDAIEINDLIIRFENWILTKGIINAFQSENERKLAKKKVETVLRNNTNKQNVLFYLNTLDADGFYSKQEKQISIGDIFYFFSLSDIRSLDAIKYLAIIQNIEADTLTKNDKYCLSTLADNIDNRKTVIIQDMNDDYFILSKLLSANNENNLKQYFIWSYCQYLIYQLLNENIKRNLISAKLLRYQAHSTPNFVDKITLLFNAFYLLTNSGLNYAMPFKQERDKVFINIEKLDKNPNTKNDINIWNNLIESIKNKESLAVKVIEKYYKGYKIEYRGIIGFLPVQNINDIALKHYLFKEIDWTTNVEILLYSQDFNFFVAKQLDKDNPSYNSENLNANKLPKIGSVISGKIKSIANFGVFISTIYGDGLLHSTNIFENLWNQNSLEKHFKVNNEILTQVIEINNTNNKIYLGFKQLVGTENEDFYLDFLYGKENQEIDIQEELISDIHLDKQFELEKGFLFEQFAIIQESLDNKVNYIKLAKQFFSNTNNARSYLLNIYIEYFNSLNDLNELIKNYSFDKYKDFKYKINSIKGRIKPMENFSESENLLFFVNILSLFNETTDDCYLELFEYIKKYSPDDSKQLLKILAKTTLSNNLLISETQEGKDNEALEFSLRNLKRIRDYIKNGVFSLEESEEDKISREHNEKIQYWLKKIREDEGEKLEFKATLRTPLPPKKEIDNLHELKDKVKMAQNDKEKKGLEKAIRDKEDELIGTIAKRRILHSALKTIAGFANTQGGHLLIGVTDNKEIFGLDKDYLSFEKAKDQNRDGFGKYFDAMLKDYFGDSFSSSLLSKEFLKFPEGDILIIKVKPSAEEIFMLKDERGDSSEAIYVRNLSSTYELDGIEMAKFIRDKYRKQFSNN